MQRRLFAWSGWLLTLTLALGIEPPWASAQVRLELEPALGVYAGFGTFTRPATPASFNFAEELSQRTTVALGGQATAWFGPHVGGRLLLFTAASTVGPANGDLLNREPVPARVTVVGLEALAPLRSVRSGRVFLAAGATVIHRAGEAYDGFEGTTDLGGTLGLGSQFRLTERVSLQGDLRALLYQLSLTDPTGLRYPSAFQKDLLAHVGLVVSLARPVDQ